MGILKRAIVVAALALAAPVWAHGGTGHDRERDHGGGWDDRRGWGHHHRWDRDDYDRGWRHYRHQYRYSDRPRQYYYNQYYPYPQYQNPYSYAPPPAYGYAAPAPGVHIIAPNVYIPFR
jgi:hypothetical protein